MKSGIFLLIWLAFACRLYFHIALRGASKCGEVCASRPPQRASARKSSLRWVTTTKRKNAATLVAANETDDFSRVLPSVKKRFVDGGTLALDFDGVFTGAPTRARSAASRERRRAAR